MIKTPQAVKQIWANRKKIELEAAALFAQIAKEAKVIWGNNNAITDLANQAYQDEQRHADLCQKIIGTKKTPIQKLNLEVQLGPNHLSRVEQLVYTSISLSCVTETLSTALLLEMKKLAQPKIIRDTVHEILTDEIRHSRIGWAILATLPKNYDLSWVSMYIPAILNEAYQTEVKPMLSRNYDNQSLEPWGILSPKKSNLIVAKTIKEVIKPGLNKFNIKISA